MGNIIGICYENLLNESFVQKKETLNKIEKGIKTNFKIGNLNFMFENKKLVSLERKYNYSNVSKQKDIFELLAFINTTPDFHSLKKFKKATHLLVAEGLLPKDSEIPNFTYTDIFDHAIKNFVICKDRISFDTIIPFKNEITKLNIPFEISQKVVPNCLFADNFINSEIYKVFELFHYKNSYYCYCTRQFGKLDSSYIISKLEKHLKTNIIRIKKDDPLRYFFYLFCDTFKPDTLINSIVNGTDNRFLFDADGRGTYIYLDEFGREKSIDLNNYEYSSNKFLF